MASEIEWMDTKQAAAYLGVSVRTLEDWRVTRRHGLRFTKVGKLVRYRKPHLDAWLASRTEGAAQPEAQCPTP